MSKKFYSQRSIDLATFIGAPLAAGYLIRENFLQLNQPEKAKKALWLGILSTIALFGFIYMLPEHIIDKIPKYVIPIAYIIVIHMIVEKTQGEALRQHEAEKKPFYSAWRAAGVGVVSLLIILVGLFGVAYFSPDTPEVEKYQSLIDKFDKNEKEALSFYRHLQEEASDEVLLEDLDKYIPKWQENIDLMKQALQIDNLPEVVVKQTQELLKYSELRLEAYKLFKKALTDKTTDYTPQLDKVHTEIDKVLDEISAM